MINAIISEGLFDQDYIKTHTEGFEDLKARTAATTPEAMSPICGIDAEVIRKTARDYATSGASIIFWVWGFQHTHGTDNARCLISLALLTGNVASRVLACTLYAVRITCKGRQMLA